MPQGTRCRQSLVGLVLHQADQQVPATVAAQLQQLKALLGISAESALLCGSPGFQVPFQSLQLAVEGAQLIVTAAMHKPYFQFKSGEGLVGREGRFKFRFLPKSEENPGLSKHGHDIST